MSLDVGGQVLLLLLERVHAGAVTEFCGRYFDEGRPISWYSAELGFGTLAEVGRLELIYPPDSGVHRRKDYGPGELVRGVHVGLTKAEVTRRVALTELGMREYKRLAEERRAAADRDPDRLPRTSCMGGSPPPGSGVS